MPKIRILSKPCPECGQQKTFTVDKDNYRKWIHGEMLVQEAFPEINNEDRERLISGICPKCWNKMFRGMEEED